MVPKATHVVLTVYDLLGQKVAELVNATASAGQHDVQFRTNTFASGMYFYRLEAAGFSETKQLLLLK